jgi:phytanoyl-CoA hydroxylase
MIDDDPKRSFDQQGYAVARGLFDPGETAFLLDHFTRLREVGAYPGDVVGVEPTSDDPLKRYPRMIHMHRWDAVALDWLLEPRLAHWLTSLLAGTAPFAVQTMLYFKPPGARGQAVHQDQYYLRVKPGTCIAAWMALDQCDQENGCLEVVPGSHEWPILCTIGADTNESFTDITVPLPDDAELVPVVMDPGDVLFFNGSLVMGVIQTEAPAFAVRWSATTSKATRASARSGITLRFDWTAARWSSTEVSAAARAASGWIATAGR